MPVQAAPYVVTPTGDFLGDDGAWSTFAIDVGTPPQMLHVLVSTQISATWVVSNDGCQSNDVSNCTQARGQVYDSTKSSSWSPKSLYQLDAPANLGYQSNDVNGTYGFDTLGIPAHLAVANVSVSNQVVASIITNKFYVGAIGLNAAPIKFPAATGGDTSTPSLLTSLKTQNIIPSLSFGYTAGAAYKQAGVTGSLVLGGYDLSRFTPNSLSFSFAATPTRQLQISIQSITYSDSFTQAPLLSSSISALVDSTVPYMWLPQSTCLAFEKAFGISWDPIRNLYLVNDTVHDAIVKANPIVSFELSNGAAGTPSVNISFPYASFDLNATYPLVKQQSRYFPLQRAPDEDSYTLGRFFLQEAFIIVDYEHSNFSISQTVYDSNSPSHVVAIAPAKSSSTSSPNPASTSDLTPAPSSRSLGGGPVAGIVVGFLAIALCCFGAFFFLRHRRRKRASNLQSGLTVSAEKAPAINEDTKRSSWSGEDEPSIKYKAIPSVAPLPMSPPLSEASGDEYFGSGSPLKPSELPVGDATRSELSASALPLTPELPGSELQMLRSELSTPEPVFPNSEMPTPEISHEMPSSSRNPGSSAPASHPRPTISPSASSISDSDGVGSEVVSPIGNFPIQRTTSLGMDSTASSPSEIRDPGLRFVSSPSNTRAFSRSHSRRLGSSSSNDAGIGVSDIPRNGPSDTEAGPTSPISPARPRPMIQRSMTHVRPTHQRLSSAGSDTWETRLEMNLEGDAGGGRRQGHSNIANEGMTGVTEESGEKLSGLEDERKAKTP